MSGPGLPPSSSCRPCRRCGSRSCSIRSIRTRAISGRTSASSGSIRIDHPTRRSGGESPAMPCGRRCRSCRLGSEEGLNYRGNCTRRRAPDVDSPPAGRRRLHVFRPESRPLPSSQRRYIFACKKRLRVFTNNHARRLLLESVRALLPENFARISCPQHHGASSCEDAPRITDPRCLEVPDHRSWLARVRRAQRTTM